MYAQGSNLLKAYINKHGHVMTRARGADNVGVLEIDLGVLEIPGDS